MLSATVDTNIYISALNFGGLPLRFLDMARASVIRVDISEPITDEVSRVLRDKFLWDSGKLRDAESLIAGFTHRASPTQTLNVVTEDPPDNRVLECAVEAASDFIVTGDRDLLRLGSYRAIQIVTVAEFLRITAERRTSP